MKTLVLICFGLLVQSSLWASLPFSVNGERLPSLAPMLKQVTPAVVNISTRIKQQVEGPVFSNPLLQQFFKSPNIQREKLSNSLGSGVIVDANTGYIITNNHVIEGAVEITVTLSDGRELYAEVIGRDPETDVAVIKIKPGNLQQLSFADSSTLQVGDFVVAIGNPFGLGQTVTSGIVSALGRSGLGIESYEDFIQTDASINLGSSGGALVNLRGELVGINTAILGSGSNNNGNIGIGFAIPINLVNDVMRQLIQHGEVKRGHLGIQVQDISAALKQALNMSQHQFGVIVTQIERASSAFQSGLQISDIITHANGKAIKTISDLHNVIGLLRIDQHITLDILRQNKALKLTMQVQEIELPRILGKTLHPRLQGIQIVESNKVDIQQGKLSQLLVDEVEKGSQAWLMGFRSGDEILAINRRRTTDLIDLKRAFQNTSNGVLMSILRGHQALHVQFK